MSIFERIQNELAGDVASLAAAVQLVESREEGAKDLLKTVYYRQAPLEDVRPLLEQALAEACVDNQDLYTMIGRLSAKSWGALLATEGEQRRELSVRLATVLGQVMQDGAVAANRAVIQIGRYVVDPEHYIQLLRAAGPLESDMAEEGTT